MKLVKRILIMFVVVAIAVGGFFGYTTYKSTQTAAAAAQSIETANLEKGNIAVTIDATGKVRSKQTANLNWGSSGQIEAVNVKVGDTVTQSQVLATLQQTSLPQAVILAQSTMADDQQALEDLTTTANENWVKALTDIATYESSVRDARYNLTNFTVPSSQASLSTAEALSQAKKNLDAASTAFEPYRLASVNDSTRKELVKALNEAQADYNSAIKRLQLENTLEVAQAHLAQAWSTYNKYKGGPDEKTILAAQAKIASDQAALNQAMIKAPFDATITNISAQPGDQVSSGTGAFRLDDLSALYVDVSVSEVDIYQVKTRQPVTITFDALRDKSYHGIVTDVSQISTDTGTSVNFTVSVHVTDADQNVHPGMTAEVKIIVAQETNALLVPLQAVTTKNNESVVYKAISASGTSQSSTTIGTTYLAVTVTLGTSSDEYGALVSGNLNTGDLVVINPDKLTTTQTTSSQTKQGGMFGIFGMLGGAGGPPPGGAGGQPPSGSAGGPPPGSN